MPVYTPVSAPAATLAAADAPPSLVVCYCAEWCGTCREYLPPFEALSARYPEYRFAWVDIEEHPELLGDEDVENFPTVLVVREGTPLFYGTLLPHIGHLERLLQAGTPMQSGQPLPDIDALVRSLPAPQDLAGA